MRSESDPAGRIADMLDAIAAIEAAIRGHDATTWTTATSNVLPLAAPLRRVLERL